MMTATVDAAEEAQVQVTVFSTVCVYDSVEP